MSNLENLTAKILADGEHKAQTIREDAQREADAMIAKAETEAEVESRKTLAATEEEAKRVVELALSAKRVALRDEALVAKQQTIARALNAAKEQLSAMDLPAYESFILRRLSETAYSQCEALRVPAKYASLNLDALNAKLAAAGKPALTLDTTVFTNSGFKLVKDDVENDNSFDALIDYYRAALERLVVEALF